MVPSSAFPLVRGDMWSGAGSNRRPSAFQVNRAKRCTDLRKRTSLTSGTALGGRCKIYASRTRYTPSTRQDSAPTQDHRDRIPASKRRPRPERWCMKWPPRDLCPFKQEWPLLSIQPHWCHSFPCPGVPLCGRRRGFQVPYSGGIRSIRRSARPAPRRPAG